MVDLESKEWELHQRVGVSTMYVYSRDEKFKLRRVFRRLR